MSSTQSRSYQSNSLFLASAHYPTTTSRISRASIDMQEGLRKPGNYPHRLNRDGTIDSICPSCYLTIGRSMWEAELESLEAAHRCERAWQRSPEDRRTDNFGSDGHRKVDGDGTM